MRKTTDALGLTRGVAGLPVVACAYLLHQGLVVLSVERHGAVDHRVQQHTQRPRVDLGPPVRPPVDDLRGRVERAATEGLQILVTTVKVGQAEVCDLQIRGSQTAATSQRAAGSIEPPPPHDPRLQLLPSHSRCRRVKYSPVSGPGGQFHSEKDKKTSSFVCFLPSHDFSASSLPHLSE